MTALQEEISPGKLYRCKGEIVRKAIESDPVVRDNGPITLKSYVETYLTPPFNSTIIEHYILVLQSDGMLNAVPYGFLEEVE